MTTFVDLLRGHYAAGPSRTAIVLQYAGQEDDSLTYSGLLSAANGYAQTYAENGLRPGEVVVLILQHSRELVAAFWGAVLHGAIPSIMPFLTEKLSPERYRADLASLVSITKPVAIVTYPEFESEVRSALTEGDSVRRVILTDQVAPASPPDFGLLAGSRRSPADIVLLQHSSGTTGLQKGVALSHEAVINQLTAYSQVLGLDPKTDVIVSWLPLYHDMGLIAAFLMPVLLGIPLVLQSPFDWVRAPYRLMQAVSKYKGTLSWLPNFAYNFCALRVRPRDMEGVDLSTWRAVINCSEPVHFESHQAFFEKFQPYGLKWEALQTSYAMAENVFAVTQSPLNGSPAVEEIDRIAFIHERVIRPVTEGSPSVKMMSSGCVLSNTRVRIVDEHRHEVPERTVGEVALHSDCMLTGYYNRPDLTKKAFHDGWYLTGDYGYLSNGELYVTGRKKDMIIVGGKNIYPQDLEALASEVDGVHNGRTVAFGLYDERQGTEEVVIVAEAETSDPDEQQRIADAVRQHVTKNSAVALRYVHIVGPKWVLKTSSGKVARSANKEKYLKEQGIN
jgi:acyl-CoA synthetase (AMP-forming)/AMP-acid ligase II